MKIGVLKEIMDSESRVALTPEGVKALIAAGHMILIEESAGEGSGFNDAEYEDSGAKITNQEMIWAQSQMILKVKEPLESEFKFLKSEQIIFTFLHLASARPLVKALIRSGSTAIDYATIQLNDNSFPILRPMSEITGKLAIRKAAKIMEQRGVLLGGTSALGGENVLIIGGGTVGVNAAREALVMGAFVTLTDVNENRLEWLKNYLMPVDLACAYDKRCQKIQCIPQNEAQLKNLLPSVDILIGAALIPGAETPHIIKREMVRTMKKGAIIIDVSIDQGGCVETSKKTTHLNPTFIKYGVVHYCVANMPGIVPRTSTPALTKETLPYILLLANKGFAKAVQENSALASGVNVHKGKITHPFLADTLGLPCYPLLIKT